MWFESHSRQVPGLDWGLTGIPALAFTLPQTQFDSSYSSKPFWSTPDQSPDETSQAGPSFPGFSGLVTPVIKNSHLLILLIYETELDLLAF